MKILCFAASFRKDSLNRKLIGVAAESLRKLGATVDLAEFREFEMPLYDGDLEDEKGAPAGAEALKKRIDAADAIVISTPEYNASIPGTLKNALDWVSRFEPVPLAKKPLLLIAASPGMFGGGRGIWSTRIPLEALGTYVSPEMFLVPKAHEAFDENGQLKDPKVAQRLAGVLASFDKYAKALATPR